MALIPNIIIAPHCIPFRQNGRDRQAVVGGGELYRRKYKKREICVIKTAQNGCCYFRGVGGAGFDCSDISLSLSLMRRHGPEAGEAAGQGWRTV